MFRRSVRFRDMEIIILYQHIQAARLYPTHSTSKSETFVDASFPSNSVMQHKLPQLSVYSHLLLAITASPNANSVPLHSKCPTTFEINGKFNSLPA